MQCRLVFSCKSRDFIKSVAPCSVPTISLKSSALPVQITNCTYDMSQLPSFMSIRESQGIKACLLFFLLCTSYTLIISESNQLIMYKQYYHIYVINVCLQLAHDVIRIDIDLGENLHLDCSPILSFFKLFTEADSLQTCKEHMSK